jgi:hypothetical protein
VALSDPQGETYDAWLAETCDGIMDPKYAEDLRLMYERWQTSDKELRGDLGPASKAILYRHYEKLRGVRDGSTPDRR